MEELKSYDLDSLSYIDQVSTKFLAHEYIIYT